MLKLRGRTLGYCKALIVGGFADEDALILMFLTKESSNLSKFSKRDGFFVFSKSPLSWTGIRKEDYRPLGSSLSS
jgi:hypothetical protein